MNRLPPDTPEYSSSYSTAMRVLLKNNQIKVLLDKNGELMGSSLVPGKNIVELIMAEMKNVPRSLKPKQKNDLLRPWHEDEIDYKSILPPEDGEKDF